MNNYADIIYRKRQEQKENDAKLKRELVEKESPIEEKENLKQEEESKEKRPRPTEMEGSEDYATAEELADDVLYGGKEDKSEKKEEEKVPSIDELRKECKNKDAEKASARVRKVAKKAQIKPNTQVKDIPWSVFDIVKKMFPARLSNKNALIAYILVTSGEEIPDDVDDEVYQLVMAYREEEKDRNPLHGVLKELKILNQKMIDEERRSKTLELGLAYVTADRLGWNKSDKTNPDLADLREDVVIKYLRRMQSEANQFIYQEKIDKGRPIR